MKVTINNKQHETQAVNLYELAAQLQLPQNGVAIAIDNYVTVYIALYRALQLSG